MSVSTERRFPSQLTQLRRAARVVHPFPSFLAAATAAAIVPLADPGSSVSRYIAIGIGLLAYQFCIGATNDVVDAASDARAKPWKPIAVGAIQRRTALLVAVLAFVVGAAATALLSPLGWLLGFACLSCGLSYDLWFKRTIWSWLPYAVAFTVLPVWVFVACDAWSASLWWVFPIGMLFGLALHLSNQAPDVENAEGEFLGLPHILGGRNSLRAAVALFGSGTVVGIAVLSYEASPAAWALVAIALLISAGSPLAIRSKRDTALFGLIAIGCAAAAIVFLAAIP